MSAVSYIPIQKDRIPYLFRISLGDALFTLTLKYNRFGDFFTVELSKDGEEICAGEKIVYGKALWEHLYQPRRFPALRIVPLAQKYDAANAVTWDNFGKTVLLTIDNGGGSDG